jgi:hypothetical protein
VVRREGTLSASVTCLPSPLALVLAIPNTTIPNVITTLNYLFMKVGIYKSTELKQDIEFRQNYFQKYQLLLKNLNPLLKFPILSLIKALNFS